jgi:hypothetical protein
MAEDLWAPFFARVDDHTVAPRSHARSPWSADMLHGRLLAGLAARAVESDHPGAEFGVVRLTVDLFRAAPMSDVAVRSAVVRAGGRVRASEVSLTCGGQEVARASALLVRRAVVPPGEVWTAPPWSVPAPEELPPPGHSPESDAMGVPDLRFAGPGLDGAVQRRAWLRDTRALIDGEAMSPLVRAVIAADVANPVSNWGSRGLQFINADLTVYLARYPIGEWVGLEVTDHLTGAGTGLGQCGLYDEAGRIGHCELAGVAAEFGTPGSRR